MLEVSRPLRRRGHIAHPGHQALKASPYVIWLLTRSEAIIQLTVDRRHGNGPVLVSGVPFRAHRASSPPGSSSGSSVSDTSYPSAALSVLRALCRCTRTVFVVIPRCSATFFAGHASWHRR